MIEWKLKAECGSSIIFT